MWFIAGASTSTPSFPPLPSPLTFEAVKLGGEEWMTAELPLDDDSTAPVYLSKEQHSRLVRFIDEAPSTRPQLLMPVGTIKSGKSTVLSQLLPRMLAAAHSNSTRASRSRRRPVLFSYRFRLRLSAPEAARDLQTALANFARDIGLPFRKAATALDALGTLASKMEQFAKLIKEGGGELWLLLDELQAPILASEHEAAQDFTDVLKDVSVAIASGAPFALHCRHGTSILSLASLCTAFCEQLLSHPALRALFLSLLSDGGKALPFRPHRCDGQWDGGAAELDPCGGRTRLRIVGGCLISWPGQRTERSRDAAGDGK